ncbi:hypothetical protein CsatB_014047 [Cannabis sativa]
MVQQLENNQEEEEEVDNTEMIIINDKRHETIEKGQIYKDKETLISTLCYFAIKKTFQYKVVKSCTKEYNIVCLDTNCKWSLKATKNGNTETFIIRSYEEEHTCAVTIRFGDQRQATSKLIADFVKPKFLNLKTKCSPADIKTEMKDKYGIKMNYMKAWRSKERAQTQLHGNAKESYNLLPRYLYMLQKTNPGTLIDIEKDDDDSFKYAFVALNAAIKAAKAYTEMEFEFHMRELDNLDKRIRPYLEKIGHEKWSMYHSENNRTMTETVQIIGTLP